MECIYNSRNYKVSITDFNCSKFIFCSDAGLGSKNNKILNSVDDRAYVITQSLKKLKKENREIALSPTNFRLVGSSKFIDLRSLGESDPIVYDSVYYKEIPIDGSIANETMIVTYSPKYKEYQRKIRTKQVERAQKMIDKNGKISKSKNPNDPSRFIKKTSVTDDGEVANNEVYCLDYDILDEESKYDGFYAVVTNLEGDISEIININKQRWQIEENFRIMKTEFKARSVYVRREDRIMAHFLICHISLLVYRLLELKLNNNFTCDSIINTLRKMNITKLGKNNGYVMSYKRTDITDSLHSLSGFNTDYDFMDNKKIKEIIKLSK